MLILAVCWIKTLFIRQILGVSRYTPTARTDPIPPNDLLVLFLHIKSAPSRTHTHTRLLTITTYSDGDCFDDDRT